ncbi:MAG TPA: prenyltransferase/squalene oxidase repeat-containing protein [Anaerolineae bacterium]|nr:prenyltransferase/squalene oxidase repeat-containing protein [Anaerolineae bacterium]
MHRLILPVTVGVSMLVVVLAALPVRQPVSAAEAGETQRQASQADLASADTGDVISKALAYIHSQQQPDGGIDAFASGASNPSGTARAVLALVAAGRPVDSMTAAGGATMIDYLKAHAITYTHDATGTLFPESAGLLLAAASAAQEDPTDFGGMDIVAELEASFRPATGVYSTTAAQDFASGTASDLNQAWAILGLSAASRPVPISATSYLIDSQAPDGTWFFGDADTTAYAVVALIESGNVEPADPVIQKAIEFFRASQTPEGGWRPSWDTDPINADTTGWIMQALIVAGDAPTAESWAKPGGDPVTALIGLQKPDGSIGGTYVNAYSTIEALFGLAGQPLFSLAPTNRAGLVVQLGSDSTLTRCVEFGEDSLSGFDVLQRSDLPVEASFDAGTGTFVCRIENAGCPVENCSCAFPPDYWSYWHLRDGSWAYASVGANSYTVHAGDVEGWSWGAGEPPAVFTFDQICAPSQAPSGTGAAEVAPSPASQASLPATPEPTTSPPSVPGQPVQDQTSDAPSIAGYVVFAVIAVVLGGILLLPRIRRRR